MAEPQAVPANQVESATAASELPASQVMSDEQKQRAIAQMGSNQGDVWVWSEENVVEENGSVKSAVLMVALANLMAELSC